ncbi:MAG: polysaccharide deacetylase family protein [Solibacillus sp.]
MLKKILFVFIVCLAFLLKPSFGYANSTTIELTQDTTARFTLTTGEVIKYADLAKNERFVATKLDNKWQLRIGNATVTIPQNTAQIARKAVTAQKRTHKVELITTNVAPVYTSQSKKNKPFATIAKNMRISSNGRIGNYYQVIIGARKGYIHYESVEHDNGVPILIYHHFVENQKKSVFKDSASVLDIRLFKEQMNYLDDKKFITISLKDFDLWTQKKQALPGKAVALTFDDANLSVPYMTYPILKAKNMYATTFVITDRVKDEATPFDMEKVQFSSLPELREIKDRIYLEYHTHGLHTFNSLTGKGSLQYASNTVLNYDFGHANDVFKKIDRSLKPSYFAYPYGKFERRQESVFIKNGVSLAFLNKGGKAAITSPRLYVPRTPVQNGTTLTQFKKMVHN